MLWLAILISQLQQNIVRNNYYSSILFIYLFFFFTNAKACPSFNILCVQNWMHKAIIIINETLPLIKA